MKIKLILLGLSLFLATLNSNAQLIVWAQETGLPLGSSFIDGQEISNFGGTGIAVTINVNLVGGYPKINDLNEQLIDICFGNDNASFTLTTHAGEKLNIVLENQTNLQKGEIITINNTDSQNITIQETGSNGGARMLVDSTPMVGELPVSIIKNDHVIVTEQTNGEGTQWNASMHDISSFTWKYNVTDSQNSNEGFSLNLIRQILNIELVKFDLNLIDNKTVHLTWETESEFNIDFYTIQRSTDGINWEDVTQIDGLGNSTTHQTYSENDFSPHFETSYYRIQKTDFNGENSHSIIKSINLNHLGLSRIIIYPNPTVDRIEIEGNKLELRQIDIYNIQGEDVSHLTNKLDLGTTKTSIYLSNLNEGTYYVKTIYGVQKIIKL